MNLFRQCRDSVSKTVGRYSESIQTIVWGSVFAASAYLGASLYRPGCNPEFFSSLDGNIEAANFCHGYSEVILKNHVRNGVVGDLAFLVGGKIKPLDTEESWAEPYHAEFRPGGKLDGREFFRPGEPEFLELIQESKYARDRLFLGPEE